MADNTTKLALCGALSHYLDSRDLSDFIIVCHAKSWKTHRLLLSLHSKVLAKSCNGDFKETKDRQIDLSEYSIPHVEALVNYLYKWDYDASDREKLDRQLTFHTQMCFIADKYDIEGLKKLSIKKFDTLLSQVQKGDEMAEAAKLAYSGPDAVEAICQSIISKINNGSLIGVGTESGELENVMEVYPQLAIDALRKRARPRAPGPPTKPKAPTPPNKTSVNAFEGSAAPAVPSPIMSVYQCPDVYCGNVNYLSLATRGASCTSCRQYFAANTWRSKKM